MLVFRATARKVQIMSPFVAGDRINVVTPARAGHPEDRREGVIKFVAPATGRVYFYCVKPCGQCGKATGEGSHRIGMSGSMIV